MNMQQQLESQWCWAAVAVSVDHYFDDTSPVTQCQLAQAVVNNNNALTGGTCCESPDACDTPARLQDALGGTRGVGRLGKIVNGFLRFADIQAQVRQPSPAVPVCVRIEWSGGGGHFLAIDGVSRSPADPLVHIVDPLFGESVWEYDEFVSAYRGIGQWTDTFLVQK